MEMCPGPVSIPLSRVLENGNQSSTRSRTDSCTESDQDLSIHTTRTSPLAFRDGSSGCDTFKEKDRELFNIKEQMSQIPPEIARKLLSIYQEQTQENNSDVTRECDSNWMTSPRMNSRSPPLTPTTTKPQHQRQHQDVFRFEPEPQSPYSQVPESVRRRLFQSGLPVSEIQSSPMDVYPPESLSTQSPFRAPMSYSMSRDSRMEPRSSFYEHPQYIERPPSRALCRDLDYYNQSQETSVFRAPKRRRSDDLDDYLPPVKRNRCDLEREQGLQYLHELRSDVSMLRERLRKPDTEVPRASDCTCAVMEKQFLELAESAYRSIRRFDCTPKGFEQFRRELIQTNDVIKDSLDVLKHIKQFCEHNNY